MNGTINNVTVNNRKDSKETTKTYGALGLDAKSSLDWDIFEGSKVGNTYIYTDGELSIEIRERLQKTFHDCIGIQINPEFNGIFPVSIVFKYNTQQCPEDKIRSLIDVTKIRKSDGKPSFLDAKRTQLNAVNGTKYVLNDETKLLLAEFMFGGKKANMPDSKNWDHNVRQVINQVVSPYGVPGTNNYVDIYVEVMNVNFRALLRKLFGKSLVVSTSKDENGQTINYTSSAKYDAHQTRRNIDGTFNIKITQFDEAAVERLYAKNNPAPYHVGCGFRIY
jgi:hypothetical protein